MSWASRTSLASSAWNSYSNYFPRGLGLTVHSSTTACVSNILGAQSYPIWNYTTNLSVGPLALAPNSWPGYIDQNHSANSVLIPLWTNFLTLTNSQYLQKTAPPSFVPYHGYTFERPSGFTAPNWYLNMTNRLLFALVDTTSGRIVDFVNLSGVQGTNITDQLWEWKGGNYVPNSTYNLDVMNPGAQWATNRGPGVTSVSVPTFGILNQIAVGQGMGTPPSPWVATNLSACNFFRAQFPGLRQSAGNLRNVSHDEYLLCSLCAHPDRLFLQFLAGE